MRPSFFCFEQRSKFFRCEQFFWLPKQTFRNERNERNGTRRGPLWGAEWSGASEVSGENVCEVTKKILRVTRKKLWPCEIKNKKMMGVSNVASIYHVKASNFVLKASKKALEVTERKWSRFPVNLGLRSMKRRILSLIMQQQALCQSNMMGQKTKLMDHQAQFQKELFQLLYEWSLI